MKLLKIEYRQYEGDKKEWRYCPFEINTINLIVGKNASGKSRVLNTIKGLRRLFINPIAIFNDCYYDVTFKQEEVVFKYSVLIKNKKIEHESLYINEEKYLERDSNGIGKIKSEEKGDYINFKIPENQLAVVRQDEIQHPSLAILNEWGQSTRFFRFAKDSEKESINFQTEKNFSEKEPTDGALAYETFNSGKIKFGDPFVKSIINGMNSIGYEIESISIGKMDGVNVMSPFPAEFSGLLVKEKDCLTEVNQLQLSDGMFRALSILIHFNYFKFSKSPSTVLIDDIGEGLDFERSSALVKILVQNAKENNIQLVMTTNDKFIMNSVELKHWHIITRNGGNVVIKNARNSKEIFDNFRFTGLNNFDFFSSEFLDNEK